MFTQPAFIRINTPELREKLIQLGHKICSCCDNEAGWIFTIHSDDVHAVHEVEKAEFLADVNEWQDMIDCGDNEEMFLAIAALRDDSDKQQWFKLITTEGIKWVKSCETKFSGDSAHSCWHKATSEELIEHFKEKTDED